jgi:hypothetical protein
LGTIVNELIRQQAYRQVAALVLRVVRAIRPAGG